MGASGSIEAGKAFVTVNLKNDMSPGVAQVRAQLKAMSSMVGNFGASFTSIGTKVASGFGAILAGLALPTKLAADAEKTAASFETITGSATTAKAVLKELKQFAAQTPFEFPELADAAKKLISFGSSTDVVVGELRRIGDVASGIGVPIGELAEIYGKARVQGRLFAEDVNQLQGRGINITKEFAKQFNVTEQEVRKLTEKGKINFSNLEQAIISLTSTGGIFAGGMARQSKTLSGLFSTLTDNIKSALLPIGEALIPSLARFTAKASEVAAAVGGWIECNKELVPAIAAVAAGGTAAGVALAGLGAAMLVTSSALNSGAVLISTTSKIWAGLSAFFATATKSSQALTVASTVNTVSLSANAIAARTVTASTAMATATVYAAGAAFDKLTASVLASTGSLIAFRGAMVTSTATQGITAIGNAAIVSTKPVALLGSSVASVGAASVAATAKGGLLARVFVGMGGVISTVASSIAGFVSSGPVAIAAALAVLAAGTAYVANEAGLLIPLFNTIKAGASELLAVVTKSFGGISAALNAGEYRLAAKILWAGIKVEFLTGAKLAIEAATDFLSNLGSIIQRWQVAVIATIAETFQKIPSLIKAVLTGQQTINQIIAEAISGTADGVLSKMLSGATAELDGFIAEANSKVAALQKQQEQEEAKASQQPANGSNQSQAATAAAKKPEESEATKAIRERVAAIRDEIEVLRYGADIAERRKLKLSGATDAEVKSLYVLQQRKQLLESQAAAREALTSEADSLKSSLQSPLEKYREQFKRINEMRTAGLISAQQKIAAVQRASEELLGAKSGANVQLSGITTSITGRGASMLDAIRASTSSGQNKDLSRDQLRTAIKSQRLLEKIERKRVFEQKVFKM